MKNAKILKGVFFAITIFLLPKCYAQRPLPDMYIDRDDAIERKASFIVKSQFLLNELGIETKDSIFFPVESFRNMVTYFSSLSKDPVGLRISFAQFPNTASAQVPNDWVNQLTILFTPIIMGTTNQEYYFINDHGDFNSVTNKLTDGKTWVARYQTNMIKTLNKTISKGDPENYVDPSQPKTFSDTRTIDYCAAALAQFIDEIRVQDSIYKNPNFITGIRCYFSSYSKKGIILQRGARYKKRLIVQFAFTATQEDVFDIDITGRTKNIVRACPVREKIDENFLSAYDNGQLCPANCPK